jgi:hypothetical protein
VEEVGRTGRGALLRRGGTASAAANATMTGSACRSCSPTRCCGSLQGMGQATSGAACGVASTCWRRCRNPPNTWSRLQTTTVNAFAAGDQVLVEQVSTVIGEDGTQQVKPVAFVFAVTDGRVARISTYRNDRGAAG